MEDYTNHTISRCAIMILVVVVLKGQLYGVVKGAETLTNSNLEEFLEKSIEKILTEKIDLGSVASKKSNIENKTNTNLKNVSAPSETTSLMDMVKNIMTQSGALVNSSNNLPATPPINGAGSGAPKEKLSLAVTSTGPNVSGASKDENADVDGLQNVLSEYIKTSLTSKIDEAKKQIIKTIIESIDERNSSQNKPPKKNTGVCVDIYKECEDMKKNGICKISPRLMMKNCRRTCGYCNKKPSPKKVSIKTKTPTKPPPKKKVVHKKPPKKKLTQKQKLDKKHRCRLHCKRHCTRDCPRYCCASSRSHTPLKKPTPNQCNSVCRERCEPYCPIECCQKATTQPFNAYPETSSLNTIPVNNQMDNVQPNACFNYGNCPAACYPQCDFKCCNPESDAVNLLKESFLNNYNKANFDQRNEIVQTPSPEPPPMTSFSSATVSPQVCPQSCSDVNCDPINCPISCCNANEISFITTATPANNKVNNDDGHYLSNSNEIVLSNCPTDCMYNCTDSCFRNKCCDKK